MPLSPTDYRKTAYTHRRGTRAAQPAFDSVLPGTLYFVTDELKIERSTGAAWESYSGIGLAALFTAGSVIFAGSTGILAQDNTNFFWDDTNDSLGILTNTPGYNFTVGAGLAWYGYNSISGGATTINIIGGISAADVTITVTTTTGFPTRGALQIEGEWVTYTGKTATTFTGCTRGRFNSTAAAHNNGRSVLYISFVSARDETTGTAILVLPAGRMYVAPNGDPFEKGSATAVAEFKIGDRFTVGSNGGVSYGDGTQTAFFGLDGTNCYFGARSNHPVSIRQNNTARVFITSTLVQLQGITNAFCALKRSSTELQIRLADDSAFAPLQCDGLTINAATGNVSYGTYAPTRSAEVNLDANVTFASVKYSRIKDEITVSGEFTADPTTTATPTSFEMTLPVASNIGAQGDVSGVAFCGAIAGQGAQIRGSVANDTAVVSWIAGDVTSQTWSFFFMYRVI